ncbi:MAG TPA: nucleotide exchange factor GrpE, partial [Thermodesulfobacteriota bacterium]|nr:nucleotide exchange factor GrpE [Thermodesulfobacteriota bacterium]
KEFHKGYYLNGRLLRPAMVVIAKATEKSQEKEETEEERTEKQSQRVIESE